MPQYQLAHIIHSDTKPENIAAMIEVLQNS